MKRIFKSYHIIVFAGVLSTFTLHAMADLTPQSLPFSQNWSNGSLLSTADDWSAGPGIMGYRGDGLTSANDVDAQTVVVEGTGVIDVNVDQATPNTYTTAGVTEFALTDPVVALAGSGTADAPFILISVVTTGLQDITVAYRLRDLETGADNAAQQIALQFRVGTTGDFTNVPAGYVADATDGPDVAKADTNVSAVLPSAADARAVVQIRIITTNAGGNDEWVGIDDISITGTPGGTPTAANLTNAYAFNGKIVAVFDVDPASVTAGDFSLSGNQALTFTAIAGTGNERSLTPSAALAVGDTTQDSLTVAATAQTNAGSVDFYAYPSISLIQDGTIAAGSAVGIRATVTGKQSATQEGSGQEYSVATASGAGQGLFVEDATNLPSVIVGNQIDLYGAISENFGVTTLTPTAFQNIGAATPIAAVTLTASDFLAANAADTPPAESYEGVLVSISGLSSATDAGFGETSFTEGVKIDGLFFDARTAGSITDGLNYDVTGIGYFSFGEYKILPRSAADLTSTAADDPNLVVVSQVSVGHTLNSGSLEKDITVSNTGATQNLTISSASFSGTDSGKFSVLTSPLPTITPGGSATIRVRFTPASEDGLFIANLDLGSNDSSNATVSTKVSGFSNPGDTLVINEFDTMNFAREYVELYNLTDLTIDLGADGYVVVFVNGNGDLVYQATALSGTIAPGGFFLLAESGLVDIDGVTVDQQATWTSFQNGQDGIALVKGAQESDFLSNDVYSTKLSGVANAWQADAVIYANVDAELDFEFGLSGIGVATETDLASYRKSDGRGGPNDSYVNADWSVGPGSAGDRNAPLAATQWTLYP